MRNLLIATQFLTRLPVRDVRSTRPSELTGSTAWFPLVGAFIGAVTAGVAWALSWLWPIWIAVLVALAIEALLTGALHEDALADFFDAFGGGWTRGEIFKILTDSRLGSYGALALLIGVGLRAGATSALGGALFAGVIAAAAIGRWMSVLLLATLPAASDRPEVEGRPHLAKEVGRSVGGREVLIGTLWALPPLLWLAWLRPAQALLAVALLAVLGIWFRALLRRRIGGTTGDCAGCLCYLGQLTVLLAASADLGALSTLAR